MKTIGYAAPKKETPLAPFHFERRAVGADDVEIEILYCGICHSDVHQVKDTWGMASFPIVPGHEIVGRVTKVGSAVKTHNVGDNVAVGCFVDGCLECDQCSGGDEQFCRKGVTFSFAAPDKISGGMTYGGFSKHMVVKEHFTLSVPAALDLSRAAPILCAGITMYSPLKNYNVTAGSRVGVIGLGGLGHMGVKLAKALGAEVTVITQSATKVDTAKTYGADHVVVASDEQAFAGAMGSLDLIISTVPVQHDVTPYLTLLDVKGTLVIVGQLGPLDEPNAGVLIFGNKSIAGSMVGGIKRTQELLNFCAEHDIHPECEMIGVDQINDAFSTLESGEVAHRYVIDMSSLSMGDL